MNKIILSGNLTKDGEFRTTESGKEVYQGAIAVRRTHKNKDGEYESDFFNIIYWQPNDYIKSNLKKGARCLLDGRIQTRTYEDKGTKKYITEIIVDSMEIQKSGQVDGQESGQVEIPNVKSNYDEDSDIQLSDSDLPF